MRYIFAKRFLQLALKDKKLIFMTGDLGFNAFESLKSSLGERFINAGVAEHNMITAAAGLSYTGFAPWVYSIAPFVSIKVLEEIRNDICFAKRNVKIVALGGGYDYAIAGPTHHALEDVAAILTLPNIKVYIPGFSEDVIPIINKIYRDIGPSYLRLTKAVKIDLEPPTYQSCRRILAGNRVTVIVLGSIIAKVVEACKNLKGVDLWLVTELPLEVNKELFNSIIKTKRVCVIEEHVASGGLGQILGHLIGTNKIGLKNFIHLYAKGHLSGKYGSREFYLKETGLDSKSIAKTLQIIL